MQGVRHDQIRESDVYNFIQMHMDLGKKHRTLLKYRAAFRHPFKFACNIDIDSLFGELYVRAASRINSPVVSGPMPTWSLDTLLEFLNSPRFEPLEACDLLHLMWKTLALILLATGRRISEVANLSRISFQWNGDGLLYLSWAGNFRSKNALLVEKENVKRRARGLTTPPTCPSISTLVVGPQGNVLLCPLRAYTIYHRRTSGAGFSKVFLWDHGIHKEKVNVQGLANKFSKLVRYAKTNAGIHNDDRLAPVPLFEG